MSSVEVRIVAVPERKDGVNYLLNRLGGDAKVYWDISRMGCIANCLRTWADPCKPETTHVAVLQDDVDVIDNFKETAERICQNFPDAIIAVIDCEIKPDEAKEGTPYILMRNPNFRGCGIIMPKKHIQPFLEFYHNAIAGYPHDDSAIGIWAFLNDIPALATYPALGQHLGAHRSVISKVHNAHNEYSRISKLWVGQRADANWETGDYAISKAYPLICHLRKEHAVAKKVVGKKKQRKTEFAVKLVRSGENDFRA